MTGGTIKSRQILTDLDLRNNTIYDANIPYKLHYYEYETSLDNISGAKEGDIAKIEETDKTTYYKYHNGAWVLIQDPDTELSDTSTNAILNKVVTAALDTKVDKVVGKQLSTNDYTTDEKTKLAGLNNYDDTAIKESISNKVDKVAGKSLISDTEITRLASVTNYDDTTITTNLNTEITRAKAGESTLQTNIDKKVDKVEGKGLSTNDYTTEEKTKLANLDSTIATSLNAEITNRTNADTVLQTNIDKKVDKVNGKSLISDSEISRLSTVKNYDDTSIKSSIANKVDKESGKSLLSDTEITRLASVTNYDDTAIKASVENKVDKVTGKGLSTNDFTTELLTKLQGLSNYDDTAAIARILALENWKDALTGTTADDVINSFKEIEDFLSSITGAQTLTQMLAQMKSDILASLATETSERKAADTTLQSNIDKKVDKVSGKSLISDTEITRLAGISNYDDSTITDNLNSEIARANAADTANATAIASETTRAEAAEKANADNITALQTTVNSANTEILNITNVIGG